MASAHQAATTTTSNIARDSATSCEHLQALVESDLKQISDFFASHVPNDEERGEVSAALHRVVEDIVARSGRDGGNSTNGLVSGHSTELDHPTSNATTPHDSFFGSNTALSAEDTTLSSLLCKICKRPGKPASGKRSRSAKRKNLAIHLNGWAPGSNGWYITRVANAFSACVLPFDKSKDNPVSFLRAILAAVKARWDLLPIHLRLAIQTLLFDDRNNLHRVAASLGINANNLRPVDSEAANKMDQNAKDKMLECTYVILHCLEHYRPYTQPASAHQQQDQVPVPTSNQQASSESHVPLTIASPHIAEPVPDTVYHFRRTHHAPRSHLGPDTLSIDDHTNAPMSSFDPSITQRSPRSPRHPLPISPAQIAQPFLDTVNQFQGDQQPIPDDNSSTPPRDCDTDVDMFSPVPASDQQSRANPRSLFLTPFEHYRLLGRPEPGDQQEDEEPVVSPTQYSPMDFQPPSTISTPHIAEPFQDTAHELPHNHALTRSHSGLNTLSMDGGPDIAMSSFNPEYSQHFSETPRAPLATTFGHAIEPYSNTIRQSHSTYDPSRLACDPATIPESSQTSINQSSVVPEFGQHSPVSPGAPIATNSVTSADTFQDAEHQVQGRPFLQLDPNLDPFRDNDMDVDMSPIDFGLDDDQIATGNMPWEWENPAIPM